MADPTPHLIDLVRRQSTASSDQITSGNDASVASFVSALVVNGAVALAFYVAFIILRRWFPMVYAPRTFLVEAKDRVNPVPPGLFTWITTSFRTPESTFIDLAGHDNYAVVYYHRTLMKLFGIISIVAIVILWPIYITGGAGLIGLNILTLGNVDDDRTVRLWANLVLSYVFVAGTLYTILNLLKKAAELRHKFLLSYEQLHSITGYTLLIRDIPKPLRNVEAIRDIVDRVQPGHVVDVILTRDLKQVKGMHDDRLKDRNNLEGAITKYQKAVAKERKKRGESVMADVEGGRMHGDEDLTHLRPTHKKMFVMGPKLDSISTYINTVSTLTAELFEKRAMMFSDSTSANGAAFVLFSDLFSPHVAASANLHETPGVMYDKQAGVDPEEVVWGNLGMNYYERRVRNVVALVAATALVVFWGVLSMRIDHPRFLFLPLAATFVSSIASLDRLVELAPFLGFFNNMPSALRGIIQGVLPTVLLAILFSLVPVFLRLLSRFAGLATVTAIESSLVNQYYGFLVFNVLLVVTISGSIFKTLGKILDHPQEIINILATTIPTVSSFFVNYILLLALSGPSGELLQISTLILKPLLLMFLGTTPRKIMLKTLPPEFKSGVVLAGHSFIATLGMTYAVVAPLVSVIVFVYFALWLVAYTYNMQYVYTNRFETGGKYLHKAAKQLFVALYLHEVIIAALFLLKQSWIQAGFVIFALLVTIGVHTHANIYDGLMGAVPAKVALRESEGIRKGLVEEVRSESGEEREKDLEALGAKELAGGSADTIHGEHLENVERGEGVAARDTGAGGVVRANLPSRYLGPDDYRERLLPPALRSAALTCWVARDVGGVSEGVKREVVEGRSLRWTEEWARMDENGKLSVESDGVSAHRFDV
ncbi:hypothetical protein HDV00_002657 [Rhizophlyctis rosea]|nr:hypothetical protein HDV00_002657 [Rhizophlyctis rosea]